MKKSRWGIYLALRESGVNTSLGRRGKRREDKRVDVYLDGEWRGDSDIGRSPKAIAKRLNVPVSDVHTTLKIRTNSLINLASRMPMDEVLTGDDFVDFYVDPYMLEAHFSGINTEGERKEISLTEDQMSEFVIKMQSNG
jgi:hypothetical protein